jgi:RNA polymerase sigma-70 factor, ECF subfamily
MTSDVRPEGAGSEVSTAQQRVLLSAIRGGDEDAFGRLVEPHRTRLHAHCYRMLGSLHDAEDALQDALLRGWRGLGEFDERRPLRPWIYKITTNVCLDVLARRPRRVLPMDYGNLPNPHDQEAGEPIVESVWVEPYPDQRLGLADGCDAPEARYEQREAVELAFVAALQHLPPRQRAVLLMREVLGFSAREVAASLEMTVASVSSALQRARRAVDDRLPKQSQQVTLRTLGDERVRARVKDYIDAWESADVDAIVSLLAEDVTMAMPPYPNWWHGRDALLAAATRPGSLLHQRWRHVPTRANGQLAFGDYRWDAEQGVYVANALEVLTLEGTRVKQITAFVMPGLFASFGLPQVLPP